MFLIPLLDLILFFSFMTEASQSGENRYGPNTNMDSPGGTVAATS
jgi:uncharacterized membrane protein YhaH (DUF805 family)